MIQAEIGRRARGELGWSAEWRKHTLAVTGGEAAGRRWREYLCESFCDTAAWEYAGVSGHEEFTLAKRWRDARHGWFEELRAQHPDGLRV